MSADWRGRFDRRVAFIGDWIANLRITRQLAPILSTYDAAGGGLLAAGLAFNILFAVLPAISSSYRSRA